MKLLGVIQKVKGPIDWCAPGIVLSKKGGNLRLCIDFARLNKAVKWEFLHCLVRKKHSVNWKALKSLLNWMAEEATEAQKLTFFITLF